MSVSVTEGDIICSSGDVALRRALGPLRPSATRSRSQLPPEYLVSIDLPALTARKNDLLAPDGE